MTTEIKQGPFTRFSVWVVDRMPIMLITETFQVLFAVSFIVLGVATIAAIAQPSIVSAVLSTWLQVQWASTFIFGGLLQLIGIKRSSRAFELSGLTLAAIGCLTYSLALINTERTSSIIIGVLFIGIALAYFLRIMISTATRSKRLQRWNA